MNQGVYEGKSHARRSVDGNKELSRWRETIRQYFSLSLVGLMEQLPVYGGPTPVMPCSLNGAHRQ